MAIKASTRYNNGTMNTSGSGPGMSLTAPQDMSGVLAAYLKAAMQKKKQGTTAPAAAPKRVQRMPRNQRVAEQLAAPRRPSPRPGTRNLDNSANALYTWEQTGKYGLQPRITTKGMTDMGALDLWNRMRMGASGVVAPSSGALGVREGENIARENEQFNQSRVGNNPRRQR